MFQEADVEMKELQKEIKESTISSGRVKGAFCHLQEEMNGHVRYLMLCLHVLEHHAYFDFVDFFYRNFTPSTTKRRPSHNCAYTNTSRCRISKWILCRTP